MDLHNTPVIITGGASGLGAATARELSSAGAKVTLFDLNEELGRVVADETGARFAKVDVSSEESVSSALAAASEANGTARVLVNCAGIGGAGKTVGRKGVLPLADFERIIKVNLVGTFNCIRLVAAALVEADPREDGERGVLINTASVAAFEGQMGQVSYSASKGGIVGLTLPVARDLASYGIRCCAIAPGLFKTPMLMALPEKVQDALGASVPFPTRLGDPKEYASLARHIIENRMLNGETIRLDGAVRLAPR